MVRYALPLTIICLVASLVLSFTYGFTKEKIEFQRQNEVDKSLRIIFPQASFFKKRENKGASYYEAFSSGGLIGFILRVEANGYNGPIVMMTGVGLDMRIKGVVILEHQETPGLGANIAQIRRGEDEPWFLKQFKDKFTDQLLLGKSIQAITGATISSNAVLSSIRAGVEEFFKTVYNTSKKGV